MEATAQPGRSPARGRRRTVAIVILAVLGGLFAVLNLDDVKVNWLLGTWSTPLIVVIAVSFLIGAGLGLLVARRRAAD
jgi:uncharacterized integral membrane protein